MDGARRLPSLSLSLSLSLCVCVCVCVCVCGVSASVREGSIKLAVWTASCDERAVMAVGRRFRDLLGDSEIYLEMCSSSAPGPPLSVCGGEPAPVVTFTILHTRTRWRCAGRRGAMGEWERSSRPCILYSRCGTAGLGTRQVSVLSVQIISKLKKQKAHIKRDMNINM